MMDKFFYLIIEGMKNTWRHKVTALTAIFSLFILLYIIGIMNIAEKNSFKVLTRLTYYGKPSGNLSKPGFKYN